MPSALSILCSVSRKFGTAATCTCRPAWRIVWHTRGVRVMAEGNGHDKERWRELSRQETLDLLDRRARELLNMSGAEFLRKAKKGTLPDTEAASHLLVLSGARTG